MAFLQIFDMHVEKKKKKGRKIQAGLPSAPVAAWSHIQPLPHPVKTLHLKMEES